MEKLFFQSSLPRSGSTLLQNLLAQNPDIYATPTSGVLELIFGARANYTTSPEFIAQDAELMKKVGSPSQMQVWTLFTMQLLIRNML